MGQMQQINYYNSDSNYYSQSIRKTFLTIQEAAKYLGYKVSTLYKMNSEGKIPFYNPTKGKVLYSKQELDEWIKGTRVSVNDLEKKFKGC